MIKVDKRGKKNVKLYTSYIAIAIILSISLSIAFIAFYDTYYKVTKTATTSTGQDIISGNYTARTASTFRQPMAIGSGGGYEANLGVFEPRDTTPPIIYGQITEPGPQNITVTWNTDKNTNATLNWGLTPNLGNIITETTYSTLHQLIITGLETETTYYYNTTNCDFNQICVTNGTYNTTTLPPPDLIPPDITNVNVTQTTNQTATIYWETNETANSTINYGLTIDLGSATGTNTFVMNHTVNVTGLQNNTLYYFNVVSCDIYHNCNTIAMYNFTTLQTDNFPRITLINPEDNYISTNRTIMFECNATDDEGGLQNITLYTNIKGWKAEYTTNESYLNYTITRIKNGEYKWSCTATDNASQTSIMPNNTLIMNSTAVQIVNTDTYKKAIINGTNITISMNITNWNYSTITIIKPDGNNETVDTTDQNGTVSITFENTSLTGIYNITFYANDTIEEDTVNDYFISAEPIILNNTIQDAQGNGLNTTVTIEYAGYQIYTDTNENGTIYAELPNVEVDLSLKTDNNNYELIFYDTNIGNITNKSFIINKPTQPDYLVTYVLNDSNFSTNTAQLKITYDGLGYYNENALKIYECTDFIIENSTCQTSWQPLTTQTNTTEKYVSTNITLTYAYSIKQETYCGDNKKNPTEQCDGTDFGTKSCIDYGFNAGNLACSPTCEIQSTPCYHYSPPTGGGSASQCDTAEKPICYQNKVKTCVNKAGNNVYEFKDCGAKYQCIEGVCEQIICQENWTCTEWRECFGGTVDRICEDLNNCNTTQEKPITTKSCEQAQTELGKEAFKNITAIPPTPEKNISGTSILPEQPPKTLIPESSGQLLKQKLKLILEQLPLNFLISLMLITLSIIILIDLFWAGKEPKGHIRTQEDYDITRTLKKK